MQTKPIIGLQKSLINKLCRLFEESQPDFSSGAGDLALRYIENRTEYLGPKLCKQLYEFRAALDTDDSLVEQVNRHGLARTLWIGFILWPVEFRNYLAKQAENLTAKRVKINQTTFYRVVFGVSEFNYSTVKNDMATSYYNKFESYLYQIIGEEEKVQRLVLPHSNAASMQMNSDMWKVYWVESSGTSLQSMTFDFSKIINTHFKSAFKYWLMKKKCRNKTTSFRGHTFIGMISRDFNFLSECVGATMPSDVTVTHVRRLVQHLCCDARSYKGKALTMASVRGHFKVLNQMFDWLMRSDVVVPDGQPPVKKNPFRAVSFKNESDHMSSAEYIPDEVVRQLLLIRYELPEDVHRCLLIMMELGLRYYDAVMLEEGCLTYDSDMEMHILKYVQHKSKNNRAKKGIGPYHEVGVKNHDVVRAIQEQEQSSRALRVRTGTKLIFVRKSSELTTKVNVLSAGGFTRPIRRLISKHNITDHDGNLWFFKSHQCRKTVAVVMVENKARPIEIRQFLGHLDQKTTDGIYAEVRKLRQGELNHEFFEKKFKAEVRPEQLSRFSEEERQVLYVEFALGRRDVELGQCLKHASEGSCGRRSGETNCAICRNICVGPQFKLKWIRLVESQELVVAELEAAYAESNIPESEYRGYREYQIAEKLMTAYRSGLDKILSYESSSGLRC